MTVYTKIETRFHLLGMFSLADEFIPSISSQLCLLPFPIEQTQGWYQKIVEMTPQSEKDKVTLGSEPEPANW
jgi:hypothetical protein